MEEIKKPVSPQCGQTARCFYRKKDVSFNHWDVYILWCEACRQRKTETRQAGYQIGDKSYPQQTACPFCDKPPEKHERGLSLNEFIRLHLQREEENDKEENNRHCSLVNSAEISVVENTHPPQPVVSIPAPVVPKQRLTVAPPPRVKTRSQMMGITKFLASWSVKKIMAFFTIAYTLVLGTLIFAAKLWDEAPVGMALQETILPTTIATAWMIICSILIVRYSRSHYGES